MRLRQDEYNRAVAMGRTNAEAVELTRRHCRHARIELVGGNSSGRNALGLPMGLMEVRCEHAAPPRPGGRDTRPWSWQSSSTTRTAWTARIGRALVNSRTSPPRPQIALPRKLSARLRRSSGPTSGLGGTGIARSGDVTPWLERAS